MKTEEYTIPPAKTFNDIYGEKKTSKDEKAIEKIKNDPNYNKEKSIRGYGICF